MKVQRSGRAGSGWFQISRVGSVHPDPIRPARGGPTHENPRFRFLVVRLGSKRSMDICTYVWRLMDMCDFINEGVLLLMGWC